LVPLFVDLEFKVGGRETLSGDTRPHCGSPHIRAQRTTQFELKSVQVIRDGGNHMADAKPSYQSQPDELELLRQETKRLRELVVELSKMAIKNAVNAK
jgi:hypothetical protein